MRRSEPHAARGATAPGQAIIHSNEMKSPEFILLLVVILALAVQFSASREGSVAVEEMRPEAKGLRACLLALAALVAAFVIL